MARAKVVKLRKNAPARTASPARDEAAPDAALPAGIHSARIELREGASFRVRITGGPVLAARLAEGMDEAFAEECLRERRVVLVSGALDGSARIVGALQTQSTVSRDGQDALHVAGRRIRFDAKDDIEFRVGKTTLRLDAEGTVRLVGQKMTMDVATVVRILSALVELP